MELTLEEVIHEMNCLEESMRPFEERHRLKSAEFYQLVLGGEIEETTDLHEWSGLYQAWLKRRERYLQLLKAAPPDLAVQPPFGRTRVQGELVPGG